MLALHDISYKLEEYKASVASALPEIDDLDAASKSLLQRYINSTESTDPSSLIRIQAIIDYMYEKINIGNWKEVKLFIRKSITIATYLKLLAHVKYSGEDSDTIIKQAFKIIDFGILFGCPLDKEPQLLQNCASILSSVNVQQSTQVFKDSPKRDSNITNNTTIEASKFNATPIEIIDCPSMEHFYKNYIMLEKPVILDNCVNHWPALEKWKDQNYFINLAGPRTVSIEIGSKYTDTDWTQKLITIEEFVKQYIYQTEGPTGYLAQYQLFDQIPELKNDITEPEYCCFSESNDPVDVMAWYGPKGTVSPLHHDPKRNLLTQVVGEKQLFLFSPSDSEYLYPHEHELLNNTAQVDPRQPDLDKYPNYKTAKPYYCILKPGQMLYIPPKWWHFVESLSISFSVSFWWE
ncbi:bifunctional peptidase and arginyl-hydroxylase JMJD5 [Helicoverpa armigera]|uniref:bifunctional peptidase and arginyl-hydroxylase JMJD5 n=1 Tax=Helicoverpa armigera TaxID=29058 RepID=UPI003083ADAF